MPIPKLHHMNKLNDIMFLAASSPVLTGSGHIWRSNKKLEKGVSYGIKPNNGKPGKVPMGPILFSNLSYKRFPAAPSSGIPKACDGYRS